jgi:hypothetical protein
VKVERPSVVRNPQHAIQPLFHLPVRGSNRVVNLIELSRMSHGEVLPETSGGLEAQTPVHVSG